MGAAGIMKQDFFGGNSQGFGSSGRNIGQSKGKTREGEFLEKVETGCSCWKG